jgi:hypothetical protein
MKLLGDAAIGLLDLAGPGPAAHTQDHVVVFGHGAPPVAVDVSVGRSVVATQVEGWKSTVGQSCR